MSANNNKMLTNNSIRSLSLYQQSLGKFVNGINLRVMNSDRMQQIQMLPPLISSDIYKHVSVNFNVVNRISIFATSSDTESHCE